MPQGLIARASVTVTSTSLITAPGVTTPTTTAADADIHKRHLVSTLAAAMVPYVDATDRRANYLKTETGCLVRVALFLSRTYVSEGCRGGGQALSIPSQC